MMIWSFYKKPVFSDHNQKSISRDRIVSAQIVSMFFCGVYVIWVGNESLFILIPVWSVYLCTIVFSVFKLYTPAEANSPGPPAIG